MEVNAKIELLAGLECIATKAITTLENYHLETIEQNSMLVLLQMELKVDLLDLILFGLILFGLILFGLIGPLNLTFST